MQKYNKNILILFISSFILISLLVYAIFREQTNVITYEKFKNINLEKESTKTLIDDDYLYIYTQNNTYKIAKYLLKNNDLNNIKVEIKNHYQPYFFILFFIFTIILFLFYKIYKKKNSYQIEKKEIKRDYVIKPYSSKITFKDIGGIEDVKEELEEIVDFLKNTNKYKKFGVRLPKGILLYGLPGVGKTMIVKALANEAKIPFFYESGSSFAQMYVGAGSKKVEELFNQAKKSAPAIIFIDEIDAVGKSRGGNRNDEREATLNQLLTEMDGFKENNGVIVIAATNKIDMLDSALLRAGRFDRRIFVGLPNLQEREKILKKYLNNVKNQVNIKKIADNSIGFTGAFLSTLVNEAIINALREKREILTDKDFFKVKDKVLLGKKRSFNYTNEQKEYHISYLSAKILSAFKNNINFNKISLLNPNIEIDFKQMLCKKDLINILEFYLSGIAVCDFLYQERFNIASEDISKAKELVKKILYKYAMGNSFFVKKNEEKVFLDNIYTKVKNDIKNDIKNIKLIQNHLLDFESIDKEDLKKLLS